VNDYEIVQAMQTYGGSFVQALATAFQCADHQHQARLKAAFPELWQQYDDLARRALERRRQQASTGRSVT
jgi:hypothetical protein